MHPLTKTNKDRRTIYKSIYILPYYLLKYSIFLNSELYYWLNLKILLVKLAKKITLNFNNLKQNVEIIEEIFSLKILLQYFALFYSENTL